MSIVTLMLSPASFGNTGFKYNWEIRINGLVYSQRKTMASQNPEFALDEQTGELSTNGLINPDLAVDTPKEVPIRQSTTYLNLLANLKYKVVSCINFGVEHSTLDQSGLNVVWTLQAI